MTVGALEFREPLMLLLVLAAVPVYRLARRAPGRVLFSSLDLLPETGGGWRARFVWVPDLLVALAVAGFALALAGPRTGEGFTRVQREGIAIMMVVDTSGSMSALDLSTTGRERTRLAAVQDVFEHFVLGGGTLPGRPNDTIGIVSFAAFADTAAPITLDHENLVAVARNLEITTVREENQTAIGDALGLAVERLREAPVQSRVAVLLTDGVNNAGVESPRAAAELARTLGIKVHTIGAGTTGIAHMRVARPGGSVLRAVRVEIDEATLRDIAARTGGRYFRAADAEALAEVYAEIDHLERAPIAEDRSRQYDEWFAWPLAAALALAAAGWLGRGTLFARAP